MTLTPELLTQFDAWLADAHAHEGVNEPTAMCLSTQGEDGFPDARIVLLKGHDAQGLHFYTHYEGVKGRQLAAHPHAALCFYWMPMKRQIRMRGTVEKLDAATSDAYFASRHRSSRIGAMVSKQSEPLASRGVFEAELAAQEAELEGKPVPRPEHWGGYRLVPSAIEFWEERDYRLHTRDHYMRDANGNWQHQLLYP